MNLFLIVLSLIVCLSECLSVSREFKKNPSVLVIVYATLELIE